MDRRELTRDMISKMSGYTWITLGGIRDSDTILDIVITTEGQDATTFRSEIESQNCSIISTFENKAMIRGCINCILNLAKLTFVKYIETGSPMTPEKTDTHLE